MLAFFLRRLLFSLIALLGVITAIFILSRMLGDPAMIILGDEASIGDIAELRKDWGLDQPVLIQLFKFLSNFMQGDWGRSFRHGRPVLEMLLERLPATIQLTLTAQALALLLAVPLGVLAAVKQKSIYDRLVMFVAMIGQSLPMFWLGLMLILVFSVFLGWFPVSGRGGLAHLVLPAAAMATVPLAMLTRLQRSSLLEVLRMDYMLTAESKGLHQFWVVFKHGLRNAFIPVITVVGIQMGHLLGGAVIVETVFAWPGMGLLTIHAVHNLDFPLIQGGVIMVAICYLIVNFFVDISYALVDPRLRKE
jgi:peptide/nickel transport system permease protein